MIKEENLTEILNRMKKEIIYTKENYLFSLSVSYLKDYPLYVIGADFNAEPLNQLLSDGAGTCGVLCWVRQGSAQAISRYV